MFQLFISKVIEKQEGFREMFETWFCSCVASWAVSHTEERSLCGKAPSSEWVTLCVYCLCLFQSLKI